MMFQIVVSFVIIFVGVGSVHAETAGTDVSALNGMYRSLNSPAQLSGWKSDGGDPCGQSWMGVECSGSSITQIKLSGLGLSGSMGYQLSSLKSVTYLDLSRNNLQGEIPYQLPPNLLHINLAGNDFSGSSIPFSISQMSSLNYLNLGTNRISGQLAADLFEKLSSLNTLDLSSNQLTGDLPRSFRSLESLKSLKLQDNQFTGTINILENLPLQKLDIENNHFSGWIPNKLIDIESLKTKGNDWSSGPAPPKSTKEEAIKDARVRKGSQWSTGVIIGSVIGLLFFIVVFVGLLIARKRKSPILQAKVFSVSDDEESVGQKKGSRRNISVSPPMDLKPPSSPPMDLKPPSSPPMDLKPPSSPPMDLKSPSSQPMDKKPPSSQPMDKKPPSSQPMDKKPPSSQPMVLKPPSSALMVLKPPSSAPMVLKPPSSAPMVLKPPSSAPSDLQRSIKDIEFKSRLKSQKNSSVNSPSCSAIANYSIEDLSRSTRNFSIRTVIGKGSVGCVYKGMHSDGKVFAVKKIDESKYGKCNFMDLVSELANNFKNPNIVQLAGYCSEKNKHMLVFEFFRNGSLYSFLHLSDKYSRPLTWATRLRIALGTARAIEHLHEVCTPPYAHKNIKSANVLLDTDLNPRLSDCGLAIFYDDITNNLGPGYTAPECNVSPSAYSIKSDIYSFGVIMLELLTGRVPFDHSKQEAFEQTLVRWASRQLLDIEALPEMVDPALRGLFSPKQLPLFADIIALCLQTNPESRPPISQVVQAIFECAQV